MLIKLLAVESFGSAIDQRSERRRQVALNFRIARYSGVTVISYKPTGYSWQNSCSLLSEVSAVHALIKASRSVLICSAFVVGMPCGKPG